MCPEGSSRALITLAEDCSSKTTNNCLYRWNLWSLPALTFSNSNNNIEKWGNDNPSGHSIYFLKPSIIPGPLLPGGLGDQSLTLYDFTHVLAVKWRGKTEKKRPAEPVCSPGPQKELWSKWKNPGAAYPSLGGNRLPLYKELSENRAAKRRL